MTHTRKFNPVAIYLSLVFAGVCSTACGEESEVTESPGVDLPEIYLTALRIDYDLAQPVYLNNRLPIAFELAGPTSTSTIPEQVAVAFNFVDPNGGQMDGCGSAAIVVSLEGSGRTTVGRAFLWPTTDCVEVVGAGKEVWLAVSIQRQDAEDPAEPITYGPDQAADPVNQACRSETASPAQSCVHRIRLEPTPEANGQPLIDVRMSRFEVDSSVAVLSAADEAPVPLLGVNLGLVVNGRDPYVNPTDPSEVPPEVEATRPGITDSLTFGGQPAQAQADLTELPGSGRIVYAIAPANDRSTFVPLLLADAQENGSGQTITSAAVTSLTSGTDNGFAHDLYLRPEDRTTFEPGGLWGAETAFVVRACFEADFVQAGNEGEGVAATDDCRTVNVMLVRGDDVAGGALAVTFARSYDRRIGSGRINVTATMASNNTMDTSGLTSTLEAKGRLNLNIGRRFGIDLVRAFATMYLDARTDGTEQNEYEVGVFAFGRRIYTKTSTRSDAENRERVNLSKSFRFPGLGFGFGPIRLGITMRAGGSAGIEPSDEMRFTVNDDVCREALGVGPDRDYVGCGVMERSSTPRAALTASIRGGINLFFVGAGLQANIKLISVQTPLSTGLAFGLTDTGGVEVKGFGRLTTDLRLVEGNVQIVGWVRVVFWRAELKVTIFRFRAARFRSTLFNRELSVSQELF